MNQSLSDSRIINSDVSDWRNNEVNVGFQAGYVIRQPKRVYDAVEIVDMTRAPTVKSAAVDSEKKESGARVIDGSSSEKKGRIDSKRESKKDSKKDKKDKKSKKSKKDKKEKKNKRDKKSKKEKKEKRDSKSNKRSRDEMTGAQESLSEKRKKHFNPLLQAFATSISDSTRFFEV